MNSLLWSRLHGGAAHFPIALIFGAALFDALGFVRQKRDFRVIGFWLVILVALGSLGAVFSGLALSKWRIGGTGLLLRHHLFVWPAFAIITGLAIWRLLAGESPSRRAFAIYLCFIALACVLISAAGFFGGEMLLGQTTAKTATDPAAAVQGRHLFLMNCAHCHGDDARGDEGPDLYNLHKSDGRIHEVVTAGIKGEMPSFAKKLNDTDIRALTAYLRTLRS